MADQDKTTPEDHPKAANDQAAPERYPPVEKDDSVQAEGRTFEPDAEASTQEGRLGPEGDPAEGKR